MNNDVEEDFWAAFHDWQNSSEPDSEPVRRLYYDDQGHPLFYSADDLPGIYIDVDTCAFMEASMDVLVRDGKLKKIHPYRHVNKLVPDTRVGTCCDPEDVSVVVDASTPHTKWRMQTHE
jgi:hypothetical protein